MMNSSRPGSSPEKINALLVDDEPLACLRLQELLAAHPEIKVVATAGGVAEARAVLKLSGQQPGALHPAIDVVFLDVEMPGGSGLSLLSWVPQTTLVVFVTAYRQYALQAFDFDALDYLLKPIDPERLENTLDRIRQQLPVLRIEATTDPESISSDSDSFDQRAVGNRSGYAADQAQRHLLDRGSAQLHAGLFSSTRARQSLSSAAGTVAGRSAGRPVCPPEQITSGKHPCDPADGMAVTRRNSADILRSHRLSHDRPTGGDAAAGDSGNRPLRQPD